MRNVTLVVLPEVCRTLEAQVAAQADSPLLVAGMKLQYHCPLDCLLGSRSQHYFAEFRKQGSLLCGLLSKMRQHGRKCIVTVWHSRP